MQAVNSQNHVGEWRSPGSLSEGSSEALVKKIKASGSLAGYARRNPEESTDRSFVCCLVEDLKWAVSRLHPTTAITLTQTEEWAIFLHNALTHDMRAYHGIAHVFQISAGASPVQLLAALFRNVITHYIDGLKLSEKEEELLQGIFHAGSDKKLSSEISDPRDLIIIKIFGFEIGMDLSSRKKALGGLDIFLSAILASRLLGDTISLSSVAQLACCLEATIPFRKANESGETPLDTLHGRLQECNSVFSLGFTDDQMIAIVQQAADLHNRVLGNMASTDLAEFLNHTWRLLPEQHPALRQHALYTLQDYYTAIKSMVDIIEGLNPEAVFLSFHGLPQDIEVQLFQSRLSHNLMKARIYLRARLLSVAVVSAIACLTGGDKAPKSFFFGDLPSPNRETTALGDTLAAGDETDDEVYNILCGSRMRVNGFDTPNAPLAAYVYRALSDKGVSDALAASTTPMTKNNSWTLILSLPQDVVEDVVGELSRVVLSRKSRIDRFLTEFRVKITETKP